MKDIMKWTKWRSYINGRIDILKELIVEIVKWVIDKITFNGYE